MKKERIAIVAIMLMIFSLVCISCTQNTKDVEENVLQNEDLMTVEEVIADRQQIFELSISELLKEKETTDDLKDWFVRYKNLHREFEDITDAELDIYDCYSDEELNLLFGVVEAEIGNGYTFEQKCNVASVIFNRVKHDRFPNTLNEVLSKDQFCTVRNGRYQELEISEDTILACEYVFMFGDTTNNALFFDSNGVLNYELVMSDGVHNFYKL